MEATIKETVKNIFKSNKFEDALELTKEFRGEYIREFGVKSWNGLVTYYKNANIIPEAKVAEEEAVYPSSVENGNEETEVSNEVITEEEVGSIEAIVADTESNEDDSESLPDDERVEYMLYQNDGDKIEWYGHFVNFKGLKEGDTGMMIRMNNLGIGMGKVLATASMTMEEINIFHKCYASIRAKTASDNKRVALFKTAFVNLHEAMKSPEFSKKRTGNAICDFVLNFGK